MAINTRKKRTVTAAPGSTTHFENETTQPAEKPAATMKNNQEWGDILIDPEDDTAGNVHFRNEATKPDDKSKGNPVKAAKAAKTIDALLAKAKNRLVAGDIDIENDEAEDYTQDIGGEDDDATFPAGDEDSGTAVAAKKVAAKKKVKAAEGPQADTHSPNGEDDEPADGYLMVGELDELDDEEFEDEDEVDADALEEDSGQTPQQSLLDVTDDHEVDAEFEDFEEEPAAEGEPEEVEDEALGDEGTELANVDDMSVLDVDGTEDEGDDAVFATVGTRLHVIKGNRIVASMGKKNAVKAGHEEHYLSDQFQDASLAEFSKFGLRAGLQKMGFILAKINVAKSEVVNKRVEAKSKQVTAAIRRTSSSSNEALGQCLAIAAVGINRQYFKDTRNELRASLEEELESAGMRGASRLVRRVFASKGIDYAKSILTLANKLVNMPEETRNSFAAALDMTADGEIEDDEEDTFGQDSNPDFQAEAEFEEDDGEEFVDDLEAEDEAPETIHAALSRPIHKKAEISAKTAGYSVTAQAILSGRALLPY